MNVYAQIPEYPAQKCTVLVAVTNLLIINVLRFVGHSIVVFAVVLMPVLFKGVYAQSTVLSQEDKQAMLERHNYYRRQVGVRPLVWSQELEAVAQQWADTLAARDNGLMHSLGKYGENIAGASVCLTPAFVVDLWAREKQLYHGTPIEKHNKYGHYTQVVWYATRKVGCAMARSKSGFYYWVCEYYPPGNYIGRYPYPRAWKKH